VIYKLAGHQSGIMDFQWSTTNDLIVTGSLDGTCRIWKVAAGKCARTLKDTSGAQVLACSFHPLNENMIVTGNSKGFVQVYNLSTGILANKNCMQKLAGRVLCMCFDSAGLSLWVGDDRGGLSSLHFDIFTVKLSKARRLASQPGYALTSLAHRHLNVREACLLVNAMPNHLLLYKISNDEPRTAQLVKKVSIKQANSHLRSIFCVKSGNSETGGRILACSGSEDATVYVHDMNSQSVVRRMQGHGSPVLDVSFNYDQSLLASADQTGSVIVWQTSGQL
jgi:WD repeat-containing protein 13